MTTTTTMTPVATLKQMLDQSHQMARANLAGMTHTDSMRPPPEGANTLNWVYGHTLFWRNEIVTMLGGEGVWGTDAGVYRGHPGEPRPAGWDAGRNPGADSKDFATIVADGERIHERLAALLDSVDPAVLEVQVHGMPMGQMLVSLAVHDAYHVGQLGLYRRLAGKAGAI